jgi:hypothetical protein
MKLLVWNSQGNKWDAFNDNYLEPLITPPQREDVVGMLVESGWAPWVDRDTRGRLKANALYDFDSWMTYFDKKGAQKSSFCHTIAASRNRHAFWIPWVRNVESTRFNTRCSIGATLLRRRGSYIGWETTRTLMPGMRRPAVRVQLRVGRNVQLTVFLVHLISGGSYKAQREMDRLIAAMRQVVPAGTPSIIVGDMNVNLLADGGPPELPSRWKYVRTGQSTQKSGGELDYAVAFDPKDQLQAEALVLDPIGSATNKSDHAVMQYDLSGWGSVGEAAR